MSTADRAGITIANLTIGYRRREGTFRVINDLSLRINPAEAYGLVGESGCGKTTVAMAVMGYLSPNAVIDSGHIFFANQDLLQLSAAKLQTLRGNRMAMVYQDPGSALNPSMRIGHQIAEVLQFNRNATKQQALVIARDLLETTKVSDVRDVLKRYPHELSGGQQQRVMLAMALATDPDLLVLDEPTTGLDATVEAEVLDLVAQLRSRFDAAILYISHNLGIVARMCERVGVLYAGHLVEEGPAAEVLSAPRHPYTSGLIRCVPAMGMTKDSWRLETIPGTLPSLGESLSGCAFEPRCPLARDRCRRDLPPLYNVAPSHSSRCFFHEEVKNLPAAIWHETAPRATPEREPFLAIEHLVKKYHTAGRAVTAVDDISIEAGRAEVLGLVGESGSGKSSLAKCVLGLIPPNAGSISLGGIQLPALATQRSAALKRQLQIVFQNPDTSLNPKYTVRRILRRALLKLGGIQSRDEQDAKVRALAAAVKLQPEHLDLLPAALSGGLRQRVAIAHAFAGAPTLVVCDEPVSALDVSVQAAILNLLADLQTNQQVSYIFISHDLSVVRYLADRIGVMYLGQLVEIGPAAGVFTPPHHPYTEALVSAMPRLDATFVHKRIRLHGTVPSLAEPPSGCRFHTRCPRFIGAICRDIEPAWQQVDAGHGYRCHISPDELAAAQRSAYFPPTPTSSGETVASGSDATFRASATSPGGESKQN